MAKKKGKIKTTVKKEIVKKMNYCDACNIEMTQQGDVYRCSKCQSWKPFNVITETKEDKKARLLKELENLDNE